MGALIIAIVFVFIVIASLIMAIVNSYNIWEK